MTPIRHRAKRIDRDIWVTGYYFMSPLTDENSFAPPEAGWYFLSGPDQPTRHIIAVDGVAYTVDPATVEPFLPDIIGAIDTLWRTAKGDGADA